MVVFGGDGDSTVVSNHRDRNQCTWSFLDGYTVLGRLAATNRNPTKPGPLVRVVHRAGAGCSSGLGW